MAAARFETKPVSNSSLKQYRRQACDMHGDKLRLRTVSGNIPAGVGSLTFGQSILKKHERAGFSPKSGNGSRQAVTEASPVPMVFREEAGFNPQLLISLLELFLRQDKRGSGSTAGMVLYQKVLYQNIICPIRNQVQVLLSGWNYRNSLEGLHLQKILRELKGISEYSDRETVERALNGLRDEVKKNGLRGI